MDSDQKVVNEEVSEESSLFGAMAGAPRCGMAMSKRMAPTSLKPIAAPTTVPFPRPLFLSYLVGSYPAGSYLMCSYRICSGSRDGMSTTFRDYFRIISARRDSCTVALPPNTGRSLQVCATHAHLFPDTVCWVSIEECAHSRKGSVGCANLHILPDQTACPACCVGCELGSSAYRVCR